ncbi:MAG: ABC transporter ATP-binding protein [Microbacteriaceae bacterium]
MNAAEPGAAASGSPRDDVTGAREAHRRDGSQSPGSPAPGARASAGAAPALHVRGLRLAIDGVELLRGVDLDLAAGECLAIVGASGSGKTLTARALLGLAPGRVRASALQIGGTDARRLGERAWRRLRGRRIALVNQDALSALDPLRRIGSEVAEPLRIHRLALDGVHALLARVQLPGRSRSYPHELSGGQRQRALIASALAAGPDVLVADEPTTALDATVQARILELLAELKAGGTAIVLVSHDLGAVARIADRVAVMHDGELVEQGPTAALLAAPVHPAAVALVEAARPSPVRGSSASEAASAETQRDGSSSRQIVLEGRGLVKRFGATTAVAGADLVLRRGEVLGLLGESGSGKTTLARLLMGLERADAGDALLHGEPWSALPERSRRERRGRIQLIGQDPLASFDPRWTGRAILGEALAEAGAARGGRADRIRSLAVDVSLDPALLERRPRELSGGQRQRLAIARALASEPDVLVADEPVSALDAAVRGTILDLLDRLRRERGLAVLVVTHDLEVVRRIGDTVAVMRAGELVEQGPVARVLLEPEHPFTRELLAAAT